MRKISIGILLLLVVLSVGFHVELFLLLEESKQSRFEPSWEELTVNKVEFTGTSGFSNNSILLYLENNSRKVDVVVKQVEVTGYGFNRTFSVGPEENYFPTKSLGQITLTNAGWTKNIEYRIHVISSNGAVCGAIIISAQ